MPLLESAVRAILRTPGYWYKHAGLLSVKDHVRAGTYREIPTLLCVGQIAHGLSRSDAEPHVR